MKLAIADKRDSREVCRWLKAHCPLQDAFPFGVRQVNMLGSLPGVRPLQPNKCRIAAEFGWYRGFVRPDFYRGGFFICNRKISHKFIEKQSLTLETTPLCKGDL